MFPHTNYCMSNYELLFHNKTILQKQEVSELRTRSSNQHVSAISNIASCVLGGYQERLQTPKTLLEELPLVRQWNSLPHRCAIAEVVPLFVKCSTKASCRIKAPESPHGIVALFDATMILLQPIVEIAIAAMGHLLS